LKGALSTIDRSYPFYIDYLHHHIGSTHVLHHLNYKTIRYPGHCEKMRFLIHDLKLFDDKPTLIKILEKSLPKIEDDILIFYASVTGYIQGNLSERHYFQKIFPNEIKGTKWTAMQTATASSLCAVLDIVLQNLNLYQGLILHEKFDFNDFKNNRFAKCFSCTYYRICQRICR
jgi:saccharopine dehydrogenase-like NADP-dependent oxidoreductase